MPDNLTRQILREHLLDGELVLSHDFSEHERSILLAGGLLSYLRDGGASNGSD